MYSELRPIDEVEVPVSISVSNHSLLGPRQHSLEGAQWLSGRVLDS